MVRRRLGLMRVVKNTIVPGSVFSYVGYKSGADDPAAPYLRTRIGQNVDTKIKVNA